MEKRYLTCIGCPMGCALTVNLSGQEVVSVEGNTCKKGKIYGEQEVISPVRTVTTTVAVEGGKLPAVSVKTRADIPKEKIFDCVRALKGIPDFGSCPYGTDHPFQRGRNRSGHHCHKDSGRPVNLWKNPCQH